MDNSQLISTLTESVAFLIIFVVAGSPVPAITSNNSYYEQIFSASDGNSFGDAVNDFFDESLNTINRTSAGLSLYPSGSPYSSRVLNNNYYLETALSASRFIGFLEIFFQLAGSRDAVFNIKITQGTTTIMDSNIIVDMTGWKTVDIPGRNLLGDFSVRITGIDTIDGDGVKTFLSSAFTGASGSIGSNSTYYHYYSYQYSQIHYYYVTVCTESPSDPTDPSPFETRFKVSAAGSNCVSVKKSYYTTETASNLQTPITLYFDLSEDRNEVN